jgi:AraC-like DNA-binding protein
VSTRTLTRQFKAATGITIKEYATKLRLEHARTLLRDRSRRRRPRRLRRRPPPPPSLARQLRFDAVRRTRVILSLSKDARHVELRI